MITHERFTFIHRIVTVQSQPIVKFLNLFFIESETKLPKKGLVREAFGVDSKKPEPSGAV